MKNHVSLVLSVLFAVFLIGCSDQKPAENSQELPDEQASEWFDGKEWLGTTMLQPSPSINKKELAAHYQQHKDRWDKAFAYLKDTANLRTVEAGKHLIDGENVFAMVSEYDSKNPEDTKFEAHKAYTDVQYVISGKELIGRADFADTTAVITPYDAEKDIAFYEVKNSQTLTATPGTFFIFFPGDAHRPSMKDGESVKVKKVVVKVRN